MCSYTQPLAELQRPSQAPGTLQRSAARAAKAASATGFDDHDLDDLPDDLPDPMMISPMPALPASSLQHEVSAFCVTCVQPFNPPLCVRSDRITAALSLS